MAVVLGAFVPDTAARWRRVAEGEVARELGVATAARKLAARLEKVAAALGDAQERAELGDEATAGWLAMVRATTYESDGAVDRFSVAPRRHQGREPQQQQALPWLLSSCCDADAEPPHEVAAELKNLNKKLQAVLKEQRRLPLHASYAADHARTVLRRRNCQATDPDIVGTRIEDDARLLVDRLTKTQGQAACEVVAIVGPDGIGKTTLAKTVYESARVRCSFVTRSWVRLFRGYTEAGLLSQIIDTIGGDATGDESIADLKAMLTGLVAKKRFLLVVDDVFDGGVWEDVLRNSLTSGGHGSKVLVTTRHRSIAQEMGASHVHRVKRLNADDGWLLLRVAACVADNDGDTGQLKGVGEKLVEKCRGIPLAIEAIAGVLRIREGSVGEWEEVLSSSAWSVKVLLDDAMTPLYVCYADQPCHLQQCFLYCSLFPPGFPLDRRVLVQQWIAERFVKARSSATIEEVAEEYYDELVSRNLLQPMEEDVHGSTERCTMHGMLHALAQILLQGEGFTGDAQRLLHDGDDSVALRHVSLPGRSMSAIPEKILKSDGIRTLLLPKNPLAATAGDIFDRMSHLRVLDLSETAIELVPETLGNIVHLRFLNLSRTRIQAVPASIGNLSSLKFLLLRECKSLHAPPKSIEHLTGLRDLDLAGTVINAGAFRVGQLTSLTSLRCFAVTSTEARATQDRGEWPLGELRHLYKLRTLHVQKLEKAAGPAEAAEAALAGKTSLRELALSCSSTVNLSQTPTVVRKIEAVFQELNPPECLESLKIDNYFGAKFPTWLSVILLPNLRRLDIIGCNLPLPPLGQLPELRSLYIADSSALKFIDAEFMGACNHHHVPFPKLQNLHLRGLHKLERWMEIKAGALPSLQAMQLESCPELRCLPGGLRHVTSLMELRIVDMASLRAVEDIAALRELSVWNTPNLKKISRMPSLEDLSISHCPVLQTVENVDRLQAVHIFDHQLQEIPRWIKPLVAKLRLLDVTSTIKLLKRCLVDGPDWSLIKDIVQVNGLTIGSSYVYYTKSPYIFKSNVHAQRNLDMEGKTVDSDNADDALVENMNVNQDVLVSSSGTGLFDSKAVKKGAVRTDDNMTHRNAQRSVQSNSRRRMHKLAEVTPEEGEAEEDADSVVLFPAHPTKAHAPVEKLHPVVTDDRIDSIDIGLLSKVTPQETGPDAITTVLARQGSKIVKESTSVAGTAGGTSVNKSAAAVGHNFANVSIQPRRVHATGSKVQTQVINNDTKELGDDNNGNVSPAIKARSRKVTFNIEKDDHADANIHSPNAVNQKNVDKINELVTSSTASINATTIPEIPPDREVAQKSACTFDSSLILEGHHTESITKSSPDQRLSSEEKEVPDTAKDSICSAVDNIGGHMDGKSISLANPKTNHEDSKAISVTETMCDSEPWRLPSSLNWRKQRAPKKQAASSADPGDGIGASIKKIPGMASKTSDKCKAESVKHPSTEASKNTNPEGKPVCTPSCIIDTTEATMEVEATMLNRHPTNLRADANAHFSIDVKGKDPHQAPKVYTAIWADTDTDTLRARFQSTMQHYRKMASRRRHRHRKKHGSGNTWSIGPVLVAVLLVVSMAQLLFIVWLYSRILNQK